MRLTQLAILAVVCLAGALATATPVTAQIPDTAAAQGTVLGKVVDTSGTALSDAEVTVLRLQDTTTLATTLSGADGRLAIHGVPSGGPYELLARKIGYAPATWTVKDFPPGDTLKITFRLPSAPTILPPVVVDARKGSPLTWRNIRAGEFNPRKTPNALFVLGRSRPDMLGDPVRCPNPPDLPLWRIQEQSAPNPLSPSSRLPGQSDPSFGRQKVTRPWLDSLYMIQRDPFSPYVLRVYVNGIRRDIEGKSPLATLREIPASYIQEMYYADCHDQSVPIDMRYSVFVVLKPLSRAEQEAYVKQALGPRPSKAAKDSAAAKADSAPGKRDSTAAARDSLVRRKPAPAQRDPIMVKRKFESDSTP
jgi:hypothetical protein